MSKTVLAMAKEAGFPFNKFGLLQGDDNGEIDADEMLNRFAELIVEECVAQVWTVSEMEHKGNILSECSKRMRKHFGVEK